MSQTLAPARPGWRSPTRALLAAPLRVALCVLLLYSAFALARLRSDAWDVTRFITAGDHFVDRTQLVAPIAILPHSVGYDGEFYYRLGLDPFTSQTTAFGITLDNPSTRIQRIGFPLLAWAASLGRPALLPWAMLGINLAGLFAIAWCAAGLALAFGLPAWLGALPALYPGFLVTIERDTTEIAAIAFAAAALAFALRRQFWRAAPFAACAVLTRESTLFVLAGFGLVEAAQAVRHRRWSWNLAALAIPAVVFVAWQSEIAHLWGASSYSGTGQNIGLPTRGLLAYLATNLEVLRHQPWRSLVFRLHLYWVLAAAMCVATGLLAAREALRGDAPAGLRVSLALYIALVACFTTSIWAEPYDFLRGCSDAFLVASTLVMLSRRGRTAPALLLTILPIWLLTAVYT